ncbi:flagellar hook-associated protein FlgK [Jonesiaceae bacterium BS-20]|uniref:Flagellar hook-associated protein 1 n=1 Tax=Jonesiaceae bacterium BS-20 TaxID=3120821 RepID=A0AAU7DXW8_9MICO
MSTFSGLGNALSALNSQRLALEVSGQNIANANTNGYVRQRANLEAIGSVNAMRNGGGHGIGSGVKVTSIDRLGDIFIDARVRTTGASAAFLAARADSYTRLESTINEPSDTGLSSLMGDLWAGFQDVAKSPQTLATKQVVMDRANSVAGALNSSYASLETQWSQHRTEVDAKVTQVNTTATLVAKLNAEIRQREVNGNTANELIDQRNLLITELSALTGATARFMPDGTADIAIGGNLIVSGTSAQTLKLQGTTNLDAIMDGQAPVSVVWDRPGDPQVIMTGGEIAGKLSALAPASQGGILASAADNFNKVATALAEQVNGLLELHGEPLFQIGTGQAAKQISVAITDPSKIVSGDPALGEYDGSIADKIGQLGQALEGPSALWQTSVVSIGVAAKSAIGSYAVAEAARASAENLQLSATSVDVDEETVNMLAFQRGYQAASRVLTTIDEMLDQLINRTGVVGR